MTNSDVTDFSDVFRGLVKIFPLRGSDGDRSQVLSAYFDAFRPWTLRQVQIGADAWIGSGKFFPKPAEWIGVMPSKQAVPAVVMGDDEAHEWRTAEQSGWVWDPCNCPACVEAGVNEKPLRFAPFEPTELALVPGKKMAVARGRWLHGWDLFRWYDKCADFWNAYHELKAQAKPSARDRLAVLERVVPAILEQAS